MPRTNEILPGVQPVETGYKDKVTGAFVPYGASGGGGTTKAAQGPLFAPTASPNGTEAPNRPSSTSGLSVYVPSGGSFTWFIAPVGNTPAAPPNYAINVTAAGQTDIPVSTGDGIFFDQISGAVVARWVQR